MTENNNQTNSHIRQQADDEISLRELLLKIKEYWNYLLSKWVTIVIAILIGGTLGVAYSLWKKTQYEATITFVMEEEKGGGGMLGAYAGIASQFGINLGGMEGAGLFTGDNIMEFLKSRRMIQKTLLTPVEIEGTEELLIDRYLEFTDTRKRWENEPSLQNFQFIKDTTGVFLQDSIISNVYKDILKNYLTIEKPDKKLNIIAIECVSPDEHFSKLFIERLINNVSDFYIRTKTRKSQENLDVLTKQVDSVRRELNEAIGGVASATQANPNANAAFQTLRVASQRRQVDVQANTAILTELVKNQELARMTLSNDRPLIQVLDRPIFPLEEKKIGLKKGAIIGGFIAGFLVVLFLFIRIIVSQIMNEGRDVA